MEKRFEYNPQHQQAELCDKLTGEIAATFLKLLPDFESKYGVDGYRARRVLGMALLTNAVDAIACGIEGNPPLKVHEMTNIRQLVIDKIEDYYNENTRESGID